MTAQPIDHHVQINGLQIHYVEWGNSAKPTVLIHHGFMDQCRAWDRVASRLADQWHLIIPDARGHGDSDWIGAGATYYFPDYLLDMHSLLNHLETKPIAFVGHSMGGSVVSYYVGTYPERAWAIVLVEGMGPPDMSGMDMPGLFKRYVETASRLIQRPQSTPVQSIEDAAERMTRWDPKLSPERAIELAPHAIVRDETGLLRWKYDPLHRTPMAVPFLVDRVKPLWEKIQCPVLSLYGADSPFKNNDLAEREACFQHLESQVIPDAGHNIHTHQDEELARLIHRFLESHVS